MDAVVVPLRVYYAIHAVLLCELRWPLYFLVPSFFRMVGVVLTKTQSRAK